LARTFTFSRAACMLASALSPQVFSTVSARTSCTPMKWSQDQGSAKKSGASRPSSLSALGGKFIAQSGAWITITSASPGFKSGRPGRRTLRPCSVFAQNPRGGTGICIFAQALPSPRPDRRHSLANFSTGSDQTRSKSSGRVRRISRPSRLQFPITTHLGSGDGGGFGNTILNLARTSRDLVGLG
jgi:hypothetical protein